jgi:hypothetical protein
MGCWRVAAGGCVEECRCASMENVLRDNGRWFAVVRWLGQRGRGVAVVGCVGGVDFHVLRLVLFCDYRGVAGWGSLLIVSVGRCWWWP